jgi:SAM-dependent methyltransferase
MAATHSDGLTQIEVEDGEDPGFDGSYDSQSLTTSLTSSVYKYRHEHGRTYQNYRDGQYPFPNDEPELDRLDFQHHMFRLLQDEKLFMAPIPADVGNVLDVGTGTGIWAIEFADMYPSTNVLGIDLSPTQPTWVPPNLQFEVCDANDPWVFGRKFDYIHARYLHNAVAEKKFFRQAYDALKPGGWFEMMESPLPIHCDDGTLQGTALLQWSESMQKLGEAIGCGFDNAWNYQQWIKDTGFVNVQQHIHRYPINPWPKDPKLKKVGLFEQVVFADGLEGFSVKLYVSILGWTEEEVNVMLAQVRKDITNRNIHAYLSAITVVAQKPLK